MAALNVGGIAAGIVFESLLVYLAVSSPAFIIGVVLFARDSQAPSRGEIVRFSAMIGVYFLIVSTAISFHFIGRIVGILEKLVHPQ